MLERPWYRHPFWQGFMRAAVSRFVAFTYLFGMGVYVGIALARGQATAAWLMSFGALAYGVWYARWQRHMLRDTVNEAMRSTREELMEEVHELRADVMTAYEVGFERGVNAARTEQAKREARS